MIGSEPLANIVPLQRSTAGDGTAVTQYDMNGVSQIGLLKIDLLGLSNLTVIAEAAETGARAPRASTSTSTDLPLDDAKTYELLGKADTHGIFQLEATFAKRILIDMQPKCLEDMGVAVALNRPGPIEGGATATWMRRKRGEEPVTYMLPELEPILKETYGAILYQDQVMKIASAVAGFTLGEADILRAAMGKKDKVKMSKQREQFLSGAAARGVAADTALQLFELIALFAGYGFNGAHSISYGLIAYQTAYLKANYPREYMCALLNSRADNFDKLKQSILDSHARGLVVRPPDVNRSASAFSLGDEEQGEILYGLRHIKNVGERVAAEIVAERDAAGPFVSLFDLCLRVSSRDLNRRVVEALIRSGACDSLGERGAMLAVLDRAIDRANAIRRERESGQTSLFGDTVVLIEPVAPPADELDEPRRQRPVRDRRGRAAQLGARVSRHVPERPSAAPDRRRAAAAGRHHDQRARRAPRRADRAGGWRHPRHAHLHPATEHHRSAHGGAADRGSHRQRRGGRLRASLRGVRERAASRRGHRGARQGRGRAQRRTVRRRRRSREDEDRVDIEPPQILAEAVYAYDDPRLAAWRRDSTVHVSVSARADRRSRCAAARASRSITATARSSSTWTRARASTRSRSRSTSPSTRVLRSSAPSRYLVGDSSYRVEMHRVRAPERERTRGPALTAQPRSDRAEQESEEDPDHEDQDDVEDRARRSPG